MSEGDLVSSDLPTMHMETVSINLASCSSVVYRACCNIPGVKLVNELAKKEWTPVVKRKGGMRQLEKGDGTRINPVIASNKELSLASARDIKHHNLDGTPGLIYRKGKTNHSFQWIPIHIAPDSPIASRTID